VAQETGTQAVIRSPHFDLETPLVSRRGLDLILHQRTVQRKVMKKKTIIKIKTNQSQY